MPCDKTALLDFLSVLDDDLTKKITLVAAGGSNDSFRPENLNDRY